MKIAVTGALGHIGSRFIHGITPGQYDEVVLIDNLATQRYPSLFNLPQGVRYRFVEADIMTADLGKLFEGVDALVHLAAITNAAGSFDNQDQVEKVNFEGTERVARACIQTGTKLVFLSTTSVYGTAASVVDESCSEDELKPQSPYAISKIKSEKMLAAMAAETPLGFVACRFGTIYGTSIGMRFHTAVNKFVWQACMGEPITVWRTALNQKRPYLELGDAVRALGFILERDLFDGQVYNVLTDNCTVGQIVDLIRGHVPDLSVKLVDAAIMNQLSYEVACEKFRALGFTFKGSLGDEVARSIALIRNARS
ncbi:MAG TPA: SDR family oxidoreductase [Polyangiaceae bacterium]|nr:SDR family oxidoreductase [Polyangiaceae bacterium]